MAVVNRFSRRGRYATFNPMSMEELMVVPAARQQQHDQAIAQAQALETKETVMAKDQADFDTGAEEINKGILNIVDELTEKGIQTNTLSNVVGLKRKRDDFMSSTGIGGKALTSYAAKQKALKDMDEMRKSGKFLERDIQRAFKYSLDQYEGIAAGDTFSFTNPTRYIDYQTKVTKALHEIKPTQTIKTPTGEWKLSHEDPLTGTRFFTNGITTVTSKDKNFLNDVGQALLQNDAEAMAYINQQALFSEALDVDKDVDGNILVTEFKRDNNGDVQRDANNNPITEVKTYTPGEYRRNYVNDIVTTTSNIAAAQAQQYEVDLKQTTKTINLPDYMIKARSRRSNLANAFRLRSTYASGVFTSEVDDDDLRVELKEGKEKSGRMRRLTRTPSGVKRATHIPKDMNREQLDDYFKSNNIALSSDELNQAYSEYQTQLNKVAKLPNNVQEAVGPQPSSSMITVRGKTLHLTSQEEYAGYKADGEGMEVTKEMFMRDFDRVFPNFDEEFTKDGRKKVGNQTYTTIEEYKNALWEDLKKQEGTNILGARYQHNPMIKRMGYKLNDIPPEERQAIQAESNALFNSTYAAFKKQNPNSNISILEYKEQFYDPYIDDYVDNMSRTTTRVELIPGTKIQSDFITDVEKGNFAKLQGRSFRILESDEGESKEITGKEFNIILDAMNNNPSSVSVDYNGGIIQGTSHYNKDGYLESYIGGDQFSIMYDGKSMLLEVVPFENKRQNMYSSDQAMFARWNQPDIDHNLSFSEEQVRAKALPYGEAPFIVQNTDIGYVTNEGKIEETLTNGIKAGVFKEIPEGAVISKKIVPVKTINSTHDVFNLLQVRYYYTDGNKEVPLISNESLYQNAHYPQGGTRTEAEEFVASQLHMNGSTVGGYNEASEYFSRMREGALNTFGPTFFDTYGVAEDNSGIQSLR